MNPTEDEDEYPHAEEQIMTIKSPKVQQISSYVFSEEELMANELNHMRELAQKQEEIVKMQAVLDELRQALKKKEEELAECKYCLVKTETALTDVKIKNISMKNELLETKDALHETKDNLNIVGSQLIQTQHELEERKRGVLGMFWEVVGASAR